MKEKDTANPFNPNLGWQMLYVFIRRSANVNLTQLDQNDLPRILLKENFLHVINDIVRGGGEIGKL